MKRPWINFAGICTLVMGIVMFCVIFGGYSSLHRSQNRIHTIRQMLTEQCTGQVTLAKRLTETPGADKLRDQAGAVSGSARKLKVVLLRMTTSQDPMPAGLIQEFEKAQTDLRKSVTDLFNQMKTARSVSEQDIKKMEKQQTETDTAVVVMIRQYNKEARYFNNRSRQFPGVYIARIFNLDHLLFPEIAPPNISSGETASAS